jgi:PadR family transcriptional regulator, regulatory protein PadR
MTAAQCRCESTSFNRGPMKSDQLSILRGTLDVLVLRAVSWQPLHGFEISLWLEERSGGALNIDDSALYQSLHRLEARELIVGEWGVSENNRRARYYELTLSGRAHLDAASAQMVSYAKTITNLLTVAAKPR